jgi:ApbE superfamily uncharacterized protein (UPF0280 family)
LLSTTTRDLIKRSFNLKETSCTIITENEEFYDVATAAITRHRLELEEYIQVHPEFQFSLAPFRTEGAPEAASRMAEAGTLAGVGPMAAVAGVIADLAVEEMQMAGAKVAVVEDGGEASLASDKTIDIALKAGESELSRKIGFRFKDFPIGVATSSGLYSHALSFGKAEAATIFAVNAGIADAAATAVGNVILGDNVEAVIEKGLQVGLNVEGVQGVFIIYRGKVGTGGKLPQMIGVKPE